jgi:hypothetical protein
VQHLRLTSDATADHRRVRLVLVLSLLAIVLCGLPWLAACTSDNQSDDVSTSSTVVEGPTSGDVQGTVGKAIHVGAAVITVKALQATFQPATPGQRLAEQTPSAPGAGQSFYQAYVRVENTSQSQAPLRVDPNDFACAVGGSVVAIDPTRSGPLPRTILMNTSIDLILTFKAPAGFQPQLLYNPPWYQGVISVGPAVEATATTTTT